MNTAADQQFLDRFSEAETLSKSGRMNEALRAYTALLADHPSHVAILNNIGLVYEKLGDYKESVVYYEKCYAQQPDQVVFTHNLANAYTRLERWDAALPLLEKIVALDFDNENNAEKYALSLFNAKSKDEAADFIRTALSKYPDNARLNRLLGRSLLYANAHVEGLACLQKGSGVIEFHPDGVRFPNDS